MSFRYDKDNLFKEFEVATIKDNKGKKEKYDNRIQFFKDHIELRKTILNIMIVLILTLQIY